MPVRMENPETLTIKIQLSLTTNWIDNQKVSWSIKTGKAWSQRPDFPDRRGLRLISLIRENYMN